MKVLGVGLGVAILVIIWVVVAITVVACWHRRVIVVTGITVVAAVISAILLLLPQHPAPLQPIDEASVIDHLFIPRVLILLVCGLSSLFGLGAMIAHWTEPIQAKPLKKIKAL
ncbi:hypothetical protein SK128_005393 [Halocaridina rubra]|uniref:Transmembrane protein 218 n=1 Tax=Halocaridina rubra TaxID=373956 RepID=A0AAN8XC39_HALRR